MYKSKYLKYKKKYINLKNQLGGTKEKIVCVENRNQDAKINKIDDKNYYIDNGEKIEPTKDNNTICVNYNESKDHNDIKHFIGNYHFSLETTLNQKYLDEKNQAIETHENILNEKILIHMNSIDIINSRT